VAAYSVGRGEAQPGPVYSFRTFSEAAATTSFIVWNDTHQNQETLSRLIGHLPRHPADFLVWNGDMFNFITSEDALIREPLHPAGLEYAATQPLVFSRGNHAETLLDPSERGGTHHLAAGSGQNRFAGKSRDKPAATVNGCSNCNSLHHSLALSQPRKLVRVPGRLLPWVF
jgi:hypothetical protein